MIQTWDSFDDCLLNVSLAVQQLHVSISWGVKHRNLFWMTWHCSAIWLDAANLAARNQNWIRVLPDSFFACDREAGHETTSSQWRLLFASLGNLTQRYSIPITCIHYNNMIVVPLIHSFMQRKYEVNYEIHISPTGTWYSVHSAAILK